MIQVFKANSSGVIIYARVFSPPNGWTNDIRYRVGDEVYSMNLHTLRALERAGVVKLFDTIKKESGGVSPYGWTNVYRYYEVLGAKIICQE